MPNLLDTINTGISNFSANAVGGVNNQNTSSLVPGGFLPTSNLFNVTPSSTPSIPAAIIPADTTSTKALSTDKLATNYLNSTDEFLKNMALSQAAHKNDVANQTAIDTQNKTNQDAITAKNEETKTLKSAVLADQITLTKNGETVTVPSGDAQSWIDNGYTQTGGTTSTGDKNVDTVQAQIDKANATTDAAWNTYQTAINGPIALTSAQQMVIDGIRAEFQGAKNAQIEANKNFESGTDIMNIVSGRNRYAPEIAAGNLKRAMDQGAAKLAEIDSKMTSTIAQMTDAYESKNYDKLRNAWTDYADYQKQKTDQLQKTKEEMIAAKKDIIAQNKNTVQASRDSAISDLINQGITDPYQLINIINYDDAGNQVGDITMKEIKDVLDVKKSEKVNTQVIDINGKKQLINSDTGEVIKEIGASKNTQIIELGGHKVLVDSNTGARIADLGASGSGNDDEKTIDNFQKDLASWDKVGTREQAIRQLQAKYAGKIEPQSIQDWFYFTYPDSYKNE